VQVSDDPRVGTELAGYRIESLLGIGGMSAAAGVTRHYDLAAGLEHDAIDARVFSGIHFRTADKVAVAMGTQVANWALDHHFAPAK
jgi:hypothetical protein